MVREARSDTVSEPNVAAAFRTYLGYLKAAQLEAHELYPHNMGVLAGVRGAVIAGSWPRAGAQVPLPPHAAACLRNSWATEALLSASRVFGGPELLGFANHWAPVQAYYAIYQALNALAVMVRGSPPKTHSSMQSWIADQLSSPASPFVYPWSARVSGPVGNYVFTDFLGGEPDPAVSNLATPTPENAGDLLAKAVSTTRDRMIDELKPKWLQDEKTAHGARRKNMPSILLATRSGALRPTTLVDLVWRMRHRSNYREADAFVTGALTEDDATDFHSAMSDLVAGALLTVEIFIADRVGAGPLQACAAKLPIPDSVANDSVRKRLALW